MSTKEPTARSSASTKAGAGKIPGSEPRAASLPPAFLARRPDRRHFETRQRLVQRVRSEFLEMPGLRLTLAQAERLFALDHARCQRVLDECVRAGWLRLGPLGEYGLDETEP